MKLQEIKDAVLAGQTVHWSNSLYEVIVDNAEQWFIKCTSNNHCTGLTWMDGVTLNGRPEQFYINPNIKLI